MLFLGNRCLQDVLPVFPKAIRSRVFEVLNLAVDSVISRAIVSFLKRSSILYLHGVVDNNKVLLGKCVGKENGAGESYVIFPSGARQSKQDLRAVPPLLVGLLVVQLAGLQSSGPDDRLECFNFSWGSKEMSKASW